MLIKAASAPGQSFLAASLDVLGGLNSQEEASAVLKAIGAYFAKLRVRGEHSQTPQKLLGWAEITALEQVKMNACYLDPQIQAQLRALYLLAHTSEEWVVPVFAQSDAGGSVMRKQIEPIVMIVAEALRVLRSGGHVG